MTKWPRTVTCQMHGAYPELLCSPPQRDELDDAPKAYLRADTCTPNEELEELLNDWRVRYKFKPEADATLADCISELRKVMK